MKLKSSKIFALFVIFLFSLGICGEFFELTQLSNSNSLNSEFTEVLKNANGTPVEAIINGGFETGDLTGWLTGPPYLASVGGGYTIHTGSWGANIAIYGGPPYYGTWIEQDFTGKYIHTDTIVSFTFWARMWGKTVRVTVTYWDDSTTIHDYSYGTSEWEWDQCTVTGLAQGKRIRKIRIECVGDSTNMQCVDDVSLVYIPRTIQTEAISNGGFETGDLTGWMTGPPYPASVGSGYTIHTGSWGANIAIYGGPPYFGTWIEQSFTNQQIHSEAVVSFTFWARMWGKTVRATVTYWDNSTTVHDYSYGTSEWEWDLCTVNGLATGKRIRKIRIECVGDSTNMQCVDDISLVFHYDPYLPDPPDLSPIVPNPDLDGQIYLDWNDVSDADNYTIYRYSSFITSLNENLINSGTSSSSNFIDHVTSEGQYYYVITATNETGTSYISNCRSVTIDLPGPDAPTLSVITPNPDNDGNILLDWDDVDYADNYTIYRYNSYITEINGTLSNLGISIPSTHNDFGLNEGIYYYVVTATNETGVSDISNCESVAVDLPGPDAPVLYPIDPNPDYDGYVTLDWDDVDYADNYTIYRHTSSIVQLNGTLINLGTTPDSFFTDSGLPEDTYYYIITASNETGDSDISNCVSVFVDFPGPAAPMLSLIEPYPDYDGNLYLDWNDVEFADNYTIYRYSSFINEVNSSVMQAGMTSQSTFSDFGLPQGYYYYVVVANNETGFSVISNCEGIFVFTSAPNAPILDPILPNPSNSTTIELHWNSDITTTIYYVYRSSSFITEINGSVTLLATVSQNSYADMGLENGIYYYAISAQNPNGLSILSNCESVEIFIEEPVEPKIPGYSIGIILMVIGSVVALMYTEKTNKNSLKSKENP